MNLSILKKELVKEKIDIAFFTREDPNIKYYSEFHFGFLEIGKNSRLFVPEMEYKIAKQYSKIPVSLLNKNSFDDIKNKTIGLNFDELNANSLNNLKKRFKKCKFKDISEIAENIRSIKTEDEISKIKKACKITDKILENTFSNIHRFKTEIQLCNHLEKEAIGENTKKAFDPVVGFGKNSSHPHHIPNNTKFKRGFCLIDFGVAYKGYHADVSRMIFFGKPNQKEINDYNKVLETQKKCIESINPGTKCSKVYDIAKTGLKENMIHNLGHGIGLKIHEAPNLSELSNDIIKKNQCFTVEPAFYHNNYGIRIEDDILMKNKPIVLTKISNKLLIVKI